MRFIACLVLGACACSAAPREVRFTQSAQRVEAWDFVEVRLDVDHPDAANCFQDVEVTGEWNARRVDGFCDSQNGSMFRIRFMPTAPGRYVFFVRFRQGSFERRYQSTVEAVEGHRKGILRVDPAHPWHFEWTGTGEHYFWNGTTAYWLLGWQDDGLIGRIIARLAALQVNRIRVLLNGRSQRSWGEPIVPTGTFSKNTPYPFQLLLNPWVAAHPDSDSAPGFDYTRFNVAYWQRWERMALEARSRNVVVDTIFDIDTDAPARPTEGSPDELAYFRYGVARLAAFSNLTWDLGNEHDHYRKSPEWADRLGPLVKSWDPYGHLTSAHNRAYYASDWSDMNLFQSWSRPVHAQALEWRKRQAVTGRVKPQVNEEYGYEDHYSVWSPNRPPGQSADANRRAAWEMTMAGIYQTTGETARRGTGYDPDTGGGWVNGRGDSSMTMLNGYAHMVDFFTALEWWKAEPHDELVGTGQMCLADPGRFYVVYLPQGGPTEIALTEGTYSAQWFNPRDNYYLPIGAASGSGWQSPEAPKDGDWVLLLTRAQ